MQVPEACRILGLDDVAALDAQVVRAAYRSRILRMHPDVSAHPHAAHRTAQLIQAYDLLTASLMAASAEATRVGEPADGVTPTPHPPPATGSPPAPTEDGRLPGLDVGLLPDGSISVTAPAEETLLLILDAAHALGEISYLDPSAGLVEVIVEFVEAPTSSLLFSFQGRGDGTTEVFCTVEPLSGGEAPPADAVTRLVVETLQSELARGAR